MSAGGTAAKPFDHQTNFEITVLSVSHLMKLEKKIMRKEVVFQRAECLWEAINLLIIILLIPPSIQDVIPAILRLV